MNLENLPGYDEAVKAMEANTSSRARYLLDLERFVEGTQYAGLPDWFSDQRPLWERAPCIVDPIVKSAIASNTDLLLGEGRFPLFTTEDADGDDAEEIEYVLARLAKQARLRLASCETFASAQGACSAAAIFGIRAGRLFIDTVRARWCNVELDDEGAVLRAEIRYPYLTELTDRHGQRIVKAMLFRRVIDAETDTTYLPAEARPDGIEPAWSEKGATKSAHGFGFCPVVWYAHMRGCEIVGNIDGNAIHAQITDELRAHDFALSQKHRAALYVGDPQWTEIGVDPGYDPSSSARKPDVPTTLHGGKPSTDNPIRGGFHSKPRGSRARKKSPGTVWQYPKDVEVELHSLPGDALDALDKHARDLRVKVAQALGVVFLDPETLPASTSLSGRALEALKARQLDRCDNYRLDFGDRFLLPAMGMLLRIAIVKRMPVVDLDKVEAFIIKQGERWSWHSPPFALAWGRYFRLDADDESKQVELAVKALDGGIATTRAAVEKIRGVFDIKDVDAYVTDLLAERQGAIRAQQQMAAQMMRDTGDADEEGGSEDATDDAGTDDDAQRAKPRKTTRDRRRGRSRAA